MINAMIVLFVECLSRKKLSIVECITHEKFFDAVLGVLHRNVDLKF